MPRKLKWCSYVKRPLLMTPDPLNINIMITMCKIVVVASLLPHLPEFAYAVSVSHGTPPQLRKD